MRKLIFYLLLLSTSAGFAQQSQQPTRKLYVFGVPSLGGTSADEQIVVQIANGGTTAAWCDMVANCGTPAQVGNNSYNPKFSALWAGLTGVAGTNRAISITSCTPTVCTLGAAFNFADCTTSCTLRITNINYNALINQMLGSGSAFNGVAALVDWDDIDMSGSINVTNGSATVSFNTIFQHCTNTSTCAPTAFACSANWNGKTIKIFDSSGTPTDRSFTLTNCTTLSGTFPGTTGTYLFHGLYDFTATDAQIATYAVNGKKVALIARPAASSSKNISTPAYVTGTEYAASQVQTDVSSGCTASTTINSNLITFSGCNEINWAGTITVTGVTALVINNCVPTGIWSYTSTTCIAQANASATATNAAFTWTPSAVEVCFSTVYAGGVVGQGTINGITGGYAAVPTNSCQNTQGVGTATPLHTAANPTGINYVLSFVYQKAWQQYIAAFIAHYNGNTNVDYIRPGGWGGGEWFPFAQTVMAAVTPSASISDPPWTRYLLAAINDQQNAAIQAAAPTMTIDTSGNNCTGAGAALDFSCADLEFSDGLFHGLTGFGSQGLSFADVIFYSGFPCSGNHCRWFDYINACQPNTPFTGCNANIKTPFLLQVQQAGESDLYNFFYGPGTANPPLSAVRTGGQVVVTFTSDPTAGGAGIKTDGSSTITMAGWDSSFNGTYQIINTSSGSKTITYNQPNIANATSATVGVVGESVFGSWSITLPFEYARGTNDVELYFDDAACLIINPQDTYHSSICNQVYINGNTLGVLWTKNFSDFLTNSIH